MSTIKDTYISLHFIEICLLSDIKIYWNAIYKWRLHSSGAPAGSVLIRPPVDLHMILRRFRAIRCSYLIKWSDEKRHSQDPSQSLLWPLTSLGRTGTEAQQHLLAAKQPAMCLSQCLREWIYSYRKCDCVSSGRKKHLRVCVREHVNMWQSPAAW